MSCVLEENLDPADSHTCSLGTLSRYHPTKVFMGVLGTPDGYLMNRDMLGIGEELDEDYIRSLPSPA